jgi:putative hydrolase of the HAD superfamily
MIRVYREHTPKIALATDAVECLSRLQGRVPLGLLTDGNSRSQWAKIDALGIRGIFGSIVVTGDWGAEFFKPNVRGFRYLEDQLPSSNFIYVADNPSKDFYAPRELGWSAIRVKRSAGLHEHRQCPMELVRFEIPDLTMVPDLVQQLP